MNKKNILKLSLDLGMLVVLVLMYNKSSINLTFHEIGGLALLGVMVIHMLINWKWVVTVTKKLFSRSIPRRTKFGYLINVLLLLSFLLVGISGIFISKLVFHIENNGGISWQMIHYTSAAIALILIGIHLGIHTSFIRNMLKKIIPIPHKAGSIIGILLTVVVFTYGCYSLTTTSFLRWLTMPFTSQQIEGFHRSGGDPGGDFKNFETSVSGNTNTSSTDNSSGNATSKETDQSQPEQGKQMFEGRKGGMNHTGGVTSALITIAQYVSITMVFAIITGLVDTLLRKKRKVNKVSDTSVNRLASS